MGNLRRRAIDQICTDLEGVIRVAGILLGKLLDGHLASFVRSEGDVFVISVNGQERAISREVWRSLPEQQVQEKERVHQLLRHRRRRN